MNLRTNLYLEILCTYISVAIAKGFLCLRKLCKEKKKKSAVVFSATAGAIKEQNDGRCGAVFARVKSVYGNLYDNCLVASLVSMNSFYRKENPLLPAPLLPAFRCSLRFAHVYSRGIYFLSTTFPLFPNRIFPEEKCFLGIFFCAHLSCRSPAYNLRAEISLSFLSM